jgi:hypothetical protein
MTVGRLKQLGLLTKNPSEEFAAGIHHLVTPGRDARPGNSPWVLGDHIHHMHAADEMLVCDLGVRDVLCHTGSDVGLLAGISLHALGSLVGQCDERQRHLAAVFIGYATRDKYEQAYGRDRLYVLTPRHMRPGRQDEIRGGLRFLQVRLGSREP